jgi:hypothetical protein
MQNREYKGISYTSRRDRGDSRAKEKGEEAEQRRKVELAANK